MAGLSRRAAILGGFGAVVAGCSHGTGTDPAPATTTTPQPAVTPEFAELEKGFSGRLGVFAMDTGSGATVGYRTDERFLMCSTHKALAAAAVLRLRNDQPGLLDRVIHYRQSDILEYAPITKQHVAEGMSVSALCEAALSVSDNTAANLLVQTLGGPPAVTTFVRSLGDQLTRLDRPEPDLNVASPGDERDTTTPAAIAADLRMLLVGSALDPAGRDMLTGWMTASTTGKDLIRAGLPTDWRTADKSGSGAQGEVNDIAVTWPPGRAPLVVAVYTAPTDPKATNGRATVASAARLAAEALKGS